MRTDRRSKLYVLAGLMLWGFLSLASLDAVNAEEAKILSHPPLRQNLPVSDRPLESGRHYFVNPKDGDDSAAGSKEAPWKTISHGVKQLQPGDTLCLREGIYYENVYLAAHGTQDKPITVRGYPGERAILDGSLREFTESPETAWEPVKDGAPGEYQSAQKYANARDVLGSFGDSLIGLQTYYHAMDLKSEGEFPHWADPENRDTTDIDPLYCGPGLWYDEQTGRIHCRLTHTHLPEPISNYTGETDPRKLPLIISPFRSIPLFVDGAQHVRVQDLVIRGGGYTAVLIDHVQDIAFNGITLWCGTYGMQIWGTTDLRVTNSGFYGSVAPWTFRGDGSKRDYPGRPHRNISRFNTHALIEMDSGGESSVFATPQNDRWEFAYCHFADAHDGVYLGGVNVKFHHNLLESFQDDGIYLSPMYLRHRLDKVDPEIHVYENIFRGMLTALAFGGSEPDTRDTAFIYRNVFDLTYPVQTGRPGSADKPPGISYGKLMGDHGSPPWPAMNIYHNTIIAHDGSRDASMSAVNAAHATRLRRVFNNIFYHQARLSGFCGVATETGAISDGNLYWSPNSTDQTAEGLFRRYRSSPAFEEGKQVYEPGSTTNSLVADPQLIKVVTEQPQENDYRLQKSSPAVNAGVPLPDGWPDTLQNADKGKPDIGAYPLGSEPLRVGPRK